MLGRLRSLDEERGALSEENQRLLYTIGRLRQVRDSLQAQNDTLTSELERIRQLIRLPDTLRFRRPDTVRRPDTTRTQRQ